MLEEIVPLDPVHFFAFQIDCWYAEPGKLEKRHLLPDLSSFHGQPPFAQVSLGWHEKGFSVGVVIAGIFDHSYFPHFSQGDAIELFFDTRDVKTSGFMTRFCHHFYFLPQPIEINDQPMQAGEISQFRSDEESHPLCDAALLHVTSKRNKRETHLTLFVPAEALFGFDPSQFNRLGFTYRIHRKGGVKQNFSASDADFSIESQPTFWASLQLIK